MFVGLSWGFTPRMVQLFVTDSIFLFFILSAVGLLLIKTWGWWVTVILYGKLLLSKFIGTGTEWFLISTGLIAEPLDWGRATADLGILLLYAGVIILLFTHCFRKLFGLTERRGRLMIMTAMGVIVLYAVYFTVTLALVLAMGF
jgi:hypothetical protein